MTPIHVTFSILSVIILSLIGTESLAFETSVPRKGCRRGTSRAYSQLSARHADENDTLIGSAGISRRDAFLVPITAALAAAVSVPLPANAVPTMMGGTQAAVRVETWPGIESLEPIYELKLSLDAIVDGVQDQKNWPYIQKRLEKFFGGFIINEKNYFMGVGLQYMNEMQYDKAELPNYVLMDKEARLDALENTMKGLEVLKNNLKDGTIVQSPDAADIINRSAQAARASLDSWFLMIPQVDFDAVEKLFKDVKKADTDRNGILTDDELIFLPPNEQQIWKKRVDKFG